MILQIVTCEIIVNLFSPEDGRVKPGDEQLVRKAYFLFEGLSASFNNNNESISI